MISYIDVDRVVIIIRREARLSLRSLGSHLTLLTLALGMIFLSRSALHPSNELFSGRTGITIVSLFLFVSLCIIIMMNSTLTGASICDERDNNITEILLSACRPEELYIGKLVGHSLVGIGQIFFLWSVVVSSLFSLHTGESGEFPWIPSVLVLAFFLPGYFFFVALHAITGMFVSRNEDYAFAQIPILCLLLISLSIPFFPFLGWGSLTQGWLLAVSYVPPFSMGAAPLVYLLGEGSLFQLIICWLSFFIFTLLLFYSGGIIFRYRILR